MMLVKRAERKRWRQALAAALLMAPAIAGCSSSNVGGSAATPRGSSGFSIGEKFSDIFGASPRPAAPGAAPVEAQELDCPAVDIRQGASTMAVSSPDGGALGLRYQVTFSRTARECSRQGASINIRVGVQGRVILGPAGTQGEIRIPLRYALVREGIQPKTIYTKLYVIPVTIGPGETNLPFIHVDETMTVPMPSAGEYDNYLIYVGFDPEGAAPEAKKKPAPKAPRPPRQ
jgi:hypothetical protein